MRRRALVAAILTAYAVLTNDHLAWADDASVIFDRAVKAHDAGKCESSPVADASLCSRAASDFSQVYAMNPRALGALRNLAYIERGLGRVASAARHFRELAEKAPSDPRPERRAWATFARDEADALAARVPHLTLRVVAPVPVGMVIRLDDDVLAAQALGVPIDLDPGEHRVHAQAEGFQPFDAVVRLDERDQKAVNVLMTPTPQVAGQISPPSQEPRAPLPKEAPPQHHSRVGPIVLGIAGTGVAALGLALGGAALVERNQNCDSQKLCNGDSLQTAHDLADVSTVLIVVGGAALVGGVIWYIATPSDSTKASASIMATPRSASLILQF